MKNLYKQLGNVNSQLNPTRLESVVISLADDVNPTFSTFEVET